MTYQRLVAISVLSVALGASVQVCAAAGKAGGVRSTQGYLGVDVRDLTDDELSALKLKDERGAEITRLDHDGPACKAGIREHDVVLQMDGRPVQGQEQFRHMLHDAQAGRVVTLVMLRDGQQQIIRATMANREEVEKQAWDQHIAVVDPDGPAASPAPPPAGPGGHVRSSLGFLHGGSATTEPGGGKSRSFLGTMLGAPYIGAVVEQVGPQLGEFFGVPSGVGLLVKSVDANSPAAEAGMRAGDVVLKVNQVTVSTENEWSKLLHESKGHAMPVVVLRERKEQTLSLTPDTKRKARMEMPGRDRPMEDAEPAAIDLL